MPVWTMDEFGNRISGTVIAVGSTPVPASFQVIRMALADGRAVTASPGHPAADGRPLRNYKVGEVLDGSVVVSMEYVAYDGGSTYDLLPSSATGLYWANGILLRSTLSQSK